MPRPPALHIASLLLALVAACVRGPQTFAIQRLPPHPSATTRLPLPPLGQTRAEHLVDGAPVWVVRTADDRVFVLAADARVELGDRGWRVLVAYDPDCDCFRGAAPVVWGPDGAIAAGTQPDYDRFFRGAALGIRRPFDDVTAFQLDRHAFTRDGEALVVGERSAASAMSTREHRPVTTIVDTPGPRTRRAASLRPGSGFADVVTDASCAATAFLPFGPPLR